MGAALRLLLAVGAPRTRDRFSRGSVRSARLPIHARGWFARAAQPAFARVDSLRSCASLNRECAECYAPLDAATDWIYP